MSSNTYNILGASNRGLGGKDKDGITVPYVLIKQLIKIEKKIFLF